MNILAQNNTLAIITTPQTPQTLQTPQTPQKNHSLHWKDHKYQEFYILLIYKYMLVVEKL